MAFMRNHLRCQPQCGSLMPWQSVVAVTHAIGNDIVLLLVAITRDLMILHVFQQFSSC